MTTAYTKRVLLRLLEGEVAVTRSAALLSRRLRSRRSRGIAQVLMETSASNASVLVQYLRPEPASIEQTPARVTWLARLALRFGDRWALRYLALRLNLQRRRVREALATVDELSHRMLASRLVPSCRQARLVLQGRPRASAAVDRAMVDQAATSL